MVSGTCIDGYYGTISRSCIQHDENGDWGLITGFCDGISIF